MNIKISYVNNVISCLYGDKCLLQIKLLALILLRGRKNAKVGISVMVLGTHQALAETLVIKGHVLAKIQMLYVSLIHIDSLPLFLILFLISFFFSFT